MVLRYMMRGLFIISIALAVLMALALLGLRMIGGQLLAVQSDSMQPIFQRNDAAITLPIRSNDIQEGHIVSYLNPTGNGITVSHRVVAVNAKLQTITTTGEAQNGEDTAVPISAVTGEVVAVVPELGKVLTIMRHPAAVLALVYIPAATLVYREMQRLQTHFTRRRYQPTPR